jgi:NAD-dependent deacetylase
MQSQTATPEQLARWIGQSRSTVAFTGAGISTAAGIPDFRGAGGLYSSGKYDPERVFDIEYFRRDPREFYRFSRELVEILKRLRPIFTHEWLARLEKAGRLAGVITQNIDPLHQLAGSARVICVHGNYSTSRCLACGRTYGYDALLDRMAQVEVPRCDCGGVMKPDVVFFGENVQGMEEAMELARSCELMLVLGSSLVVYPAALVPQMATGAVVVVNLGEVALEPAPNRYFVEQGLDEFFKEVAAAMARAR